MRRPGGRRICPVCRQTVLPTKTGNVYGHWDSIGRDICPMSAHPYESTISPRPIEVPA